MSLTYLAEMRSKCFLVCMLRDISEISFLYLYSDISCQISRSPLSDVISRQISKMTKKWYHFLCMRYLVPSGICLAWFKHYILYLKQDFLNLKMLQLKVRPETMLELSICFCSEYFSPNRLLFIVFSFVVTYNYVSNRYNNKNNGKPRST